VHDTTTTTTTTTTTSIATHMVGIDRRRLLHCQLAIESDKVIDFDSQCSHGFSSGEGTEVRRSMLQIQRTNALKEALHKGGGQGGGAFGTYGNTVSATVSQRQHARRQLTSWAMLRDPS
jgi:hypothetical protein